MGAFLFSVFSQTSSPGSTPHLPVFHPTEEEVLFPQTRGAPLHSSAAGVLEGHRKGFPPEKREWAVSSGVAHPGPSLSPSLRGLA